MLRYLDLANTSDAWQCDVSPDNEWKATVNPPAAALWDPTKNGDLMPTGILAYSHKKHWFVILGKAALQRAVGNFKREVGEGVA